MATITSTAFTKSVAAVNVINTYYGRGDIALGAYKGPFGSDIGLQNDYAEDLINNFPNGGITDASQVPDAIETYVKVLAAAEANSVTIASIGFPINIRDLLRHYPDLFAAKVKEVYYMNGGYNFGCAAHLLGDDTDCHGAAQEVQVKFPHNVKEYFQLNGADICTGLPFAQNTCGDDSNPMKKAHNDWMKNRGQDSKCWPARPSWDPVTVYTAILGSDAAGMWQLAGTDEIDINGHENFDTSWTTNNEQNLIFND